MEFHQTNVNIMAPEANKTIYVTQQKQHDVLPKFSAGRRNSEIYFLVLDLRTFKNQQDLLRQFFCTAQKNKKKKEEKEEEVVEE
jgi:hypothetical protein